MTVPPGDGAHIVLDPDHLRQVAIRMRGASLVLSSGGRELVTASMPAMPSAVGAAVSEVIRRANVELQALAVELLQEAGQLLARATWAELGGGEAVAWLIPGLQPRPLSLSRAQPVTPSTAQARVTDERLMRDERWAVRLLDDMTDALRVSDDHRVGQPDEVDEFSGADLIEFEKSPPADTLGSMTTVAGGMPGIYDQGLLESPVDLVPAAGGSGQGAVGAGFGDITASGTGTGLVGCLVIGGALGNARGDQAR